VLNTLLRVRRGVTKATKVRFWSHVYSLKIVLFYFVIIMVVFMQYKNDFLMFWNTRNKRWLLWQYLFWAIYLNVSLHHWIRMTWCRISNLLSCVFGSNTIAWSSRGCWWLVSRPELWLGWTNIITVKLERWKCLILKGDYFISLMIVFYHILFE
jgi:hypothetical protein